MYKVIYLAVKHALNDSKALRELRDEIRANRSFGPPSGPLSNPTDGQGGGA